MPTTFILRVRPTDDETVRLEPICALSLRAMPLPIGRRAQPVEAALAQVFFQFRYTPLGFGLGADKSDADILAAIAKNGLAAQCRAHRNAR